MDATERKTIEISIKSILNCNAKVGADIYTIKSMCAYSVCLFDLFVSIYFFSINLQHSFMKMKASAWNQKLAILNDFLRA